MERREEERRGRIRGRRRGKVCAVGGGCVDGAVWDTRALRVETQENKHVGTQRRYAVSIALLFDFACMPESPNPGSPLESPIH